MGNQEGDCPKQCPFYVLLFFVKLAGAVFCGFFYETIINFYTIPVALCMSVTLACMRCNKKAAKGSMAIVYLGGIIGFNVLWVMAIEQAKASESWDYVEVTTTNEAQIYLLLCILLIIDMFNVRKLFMKIGRNSCLSQELKMEFKKIKMCKRQTKYAQMQLDMLIMQMGQWNYEKMEKKEQKQFKGEKELTQTEIQYGKRKKNKQHKWQPTEQMYVQYAQIKIYQVQMIQTQMGKPMPKGYAVPSVPGSSMTSPLMGGQPQMMAMQPGMQPGMQSGYQQPVYQQPSYQQPGMQQQMMQQPAVQQSGMQQQPGQQMMQPSFQQPDMNQR